MSGAPYRIAARLPGSRERAYPARLGLAPWLLAALLACVAALPCCSATPRTVASATILAAADVVHQLELANDLVYNHAVDETAAPLRARHATRAEIDHALEPLDAEYTARVHAVASASAALYAAAGIVTASKSGDLAAYRHPAAMVLRALREALDALTTGDVLSPVDVPQAVTDTLAALEALAAGDTGEMDAGGTDGHE